MEIIDAYAHVWIPGNEKYPLAPDKPVVEFYHGSAELLLELMEENNVQRTVLVQPSIYDDDNSYMMDCKDRYPTRFEAVVAVDQQSKSAPADLEYWVKQRGAQGIRLRILNYPDSQWDHGKPEFALWEKIRELGISVEYSINPLQASRVEDMLRRFPEAPVILGHLGRPITAESPEFPSFKNILALAAYPQTYTRMSGMAYLSNQGYPHYDVIACVEKAVQAFGVQRITWGTDFCFTLGSHDYHQGIEIVEKFMSFLDADDKEWIYHRTARKLFNFHD